MPQSSLQIVEFGPVRAIGMAMRGLPGKSDFAGFWQKGFGSRMGEIQHPKGCMMFGVCRCIPGATDGTFEYVAMMEATADAPVPAGMVEIVLPRCTYAAFAVESYAKFHEAWVGSREALLGQKEWKKFCGPDGCECATHPAFEYYPPDSYKTGKAWVYKPVRKG